MSMLSEPDPTYSPSSLESQATFTHNQMASNEPTHDQLTVSKDPNHPELRNRPTRVGIIGGGTAGSTIAIRLAELGIETYLFERKASLIDGPPMCHLHAGGNLYREIPDSDCVALLEQCIDILRLYPYTIDVRPTVFAVPTRDPGTPQELLPRLEILQQAYQGLVDQDPHNKVLGEPDAYYQLYDEATLRALAQLESVQVPATMDEWMIPVAKRLDLTKVKFPLIVVQEYGWNIFRMAASATLALSHQPRAHVFTNTTVTQVSQLTSKSEQDLPTNKAASSDDTNSNHILGWQIDYLVNDGSVDSDTSPAQSPVSDQVQVDYLINACGFRTGIIDDMVGIETERMVEFKSSYVTYWDEIGDTAQQIPEIIIYGERGTPNGMAQLTPYPEGFFQIHGMSKDVTLFKDGLVASSATSAQPDLPDKYVEYIEHGWDPFALKARSQRAIDYVAEFIPSFGSAITIGNALYGGQQIPGHDDTLRVADVSLYDDKRYARAENVKASSALLAADEIVMTLTGLGLLKLTEKEEDNRQQHQWHYLAAVDEGNIDNVAYSLAKLRHFPTAMSKVNHSITAAAVADLTATID
ncbi:MAG: FAD-dependent oxidoreductase [Psychrobacter sp.]|nr:FAD-dependent oxidoreductase [Psychrobacter sp.]